MRPWTEKCAAKRLGIFFVVAAILISWGLSSPVTADLISIQIEATSKFESATYLWVIPKELDGAGHMDWQMLAPLYLGGGDEPVATFDMLVLGMDGDPGITMGFTVFAGAADTLFKITSAIVGFDPMTDPQAYASAAVTLTDTNSNKASLTGGYAGEKVFEARYNATPTVWTVWTDILGSISAGVDASAAASDRRPATGRETIYDTLTSIQSEFKFTLSARDWASGTSRFDVQPAPPPVPEPGTWVLFGTGALGFFGYVLRKRMK